MCIQPILEHACAVWNPHTSNLINMPECVQNRAARFVACDYDFCSSAFCIKGHLAWFASKEVRTSREIGDNVQLLVFSQNLDEPRTVYSTTVPCFRALGP